MKWINCRLSMKKDCEEMIPIFSQLFLHKRVHFQRAKPGLHVLSLWRPCRGFPSRVKQVLSLQHTSTFLLVD